MKWIVVLIIFVVASEANNSIYDEFVTMIAPKTVAEGENFYINFLSRNLDAGTEVGVQLSKLFMSIKLRDVKFESLVFENIKFGAKNSKNLIVTFYRETKQGKKCSTKTFEVKADKRNNNVFIQLDKPIYKPGDTIQFRVLVVDRHLIPIRINNIEVLIKDPYDRTITKYTDLSNNNNFGVFENNFTMTSEIALGDWKIKVKYQNSTASKIIPVQEYVIPLFKPYIEIETKHVLVDQPFHMNMYAKYSFGDLVKGSANLIIQSMENNITLYNKTFRIETTHKEEIYLGSAIDSTVDSTMPVIATLIFTESESNLSFKKTMKLYVHPDKNPRVDVISAETFFPGHDYAIKMNLFSWTNEPLVNKRKSVDVQWEFYDQNRNSHSDQIYLAATESVKILEIPVPMNVTKFEYKVKFDNFQFTKKVALGTLDKLKNSLKVSYTYNSRTNKLKVNVTYSEKMDEVFVNVISRFGVVYYNLFDCNNKKDCKFSVDVNHNMFPDATLSVFYVKEKSDVRKGEVKITNELLGKHNLVLELSNETIKTNETINMNFYSENSSTVYLLAYDIGLTQLREPVNEIRLQEVQERLANYDKNFHIYSEFLDSWKTCNAEELERISKAKHSVATQTNNHTTVCECVEELSSEVFDESNDHSLSSAKKTGEDREDLREVWLFEKLEIGNNGTVSKSYSVPDSITSWQISAFGFNKDDGLAIMPVKKLTVKNDFFMKMVLPYSIRFMEILRLDILVYNYVDELHTLNVNVELHNDDPKEFEFIRFSTDGICVPSTDPNPIRNKSFVLEYGNVKRVSFYVRPIAKNDEVENLEKKLRATAIGTYRKGSQTFSYRDQLVEKLHVLPMGVREYDTITYTYRKDNSTPITHNRNRPKSDSDNVKLSKMFVVVIGDFIKKDDLLDKSIRYPSGCMYQSLTLMRREIEKCRYYEAQNITLQNALKEISKHKQHVLNKKSEYAYITESGFRAFFIDTFITGVKLGILNNETLKNLVNAELDNLKNATVDEIVVNFNDYPQFSSQHAPTAKYLKVAYILSVFLKHRDFIDRKFDALIKRLESYIKNKDNLLHVYPNALSMAAYVHSLNSNVDDANKILSKIGRTYADSLDGSGEKQCLKINSSDANCDFMHTLYAALAYAKLSNVTAVLPLVNWIAHQNIQYERDSYTDLNAFATEAIAEAIKMVKVKKTNLEITLKDGVNKEKTIKINDVNKGLVHEEVFSKDMQNIEATINGTGFFSIQFIHELIRTGTYINSKYSLTVNSYLYKTSSYTVKVCGTYLPKTDKARPIRNVIYDIELPSGYTLERFLNEKELRNNVKQIERRNNLTQLILYFEQFNPNKQYCIQLIARKAFEVRELQKAAVKIYDYDNKDSISVYFYDFNNPKCN